MQRYRAAFSVFIQPAVSKQIFCFHLMCDLLLTKGKVSYKKISFSTQKCWIQQVFHIRITRS